MSSSHRSSKNLAAAQIAYNISARSTSQMPSKMLSRKKRAFMVRSGRWKSRVVVGESAGSEEERKKDEEKWAGGSFKYCNCEGARAYRQQCFPVSEFAQEVIGYVGGRMSFYPD